MKSRRISGTIQWLALITVLTVVLGSGTPSPAHAQDSDDPSVPFIQDLAAQFGVPPSQITYRQGSMTNADYYHQIMFYSESQLDDYTINISRGKDSNGSDSGIYWAKRTYAGEENTGIYTMSTAKFHAVTSYMAALQDSELISQHMFWGSGQWGFEIFHRVTPGQAELPPIETIAEKVYATGVKHDLISETASPDLPTPTPAKIPGKLNCTIKGHPSAPLLFTLEAYNPDGTRPQTIQLHWEGMLAPLLAIYDKESDNWVAWDASDRTQTISSNQPGIFAIRALLRLDQRIPSPKQPITGTLSATATNPGDSKPVSLGSCNLSIDHIGFIYKATTAVKGERDGKTRYLSPGDPVFMGERLVLEADPAFANPSPGVPVQEKNRTATFTIVFLDGTSLQSGFDQTSNKEATVLISNKEGKIAVWLATKLVGEVGGKIVEVGMKFAVRRLIGVINLPAAVAIEVMSDIAGDQIGSMACEDENATKCNVVVVNKSDMRPSRLGVDIKPKAEVTPWSFFEIAVLNNGWRIRTIEGNPDVLTAGGQHITLEANQEIQLDGDGKLVTTTGFSPQQSDAWWNPELLTPTELVDNDVVVAINSAGTTTPGTPSSAANDLTDWLPSLPSNTALMAILGLGGCGTLAMGLVVVILVARGLSGSRRSRRTAQPAYPPVPAPYYTYPTPASPMHPSQYPPLAYYPPPPKARQSWVIWVILLLTLPCVCLIAFRILRFFPIEALINTLGSGF